MTKKWSMTIPAEGVPLTGLAVVGNGKDLELRLDRAGRPRLVIGLASAEVSTADGVTLDVSRIDDVSLSLDYSARHLTLTGLHVRWDSDEWTADLEDDLAKLFDDTVPKDPRDHELLWCVHAEVSLTSGTANREVQP